MTRGEAAEAAVREHSCPYCKAPAGQRCTFDGPGQGEYKKPHIERMLEVPQWADQRAGDGNGRRQSQGEPATAERRS
jgi:hypothetical protein